MLVATDTCAAAAALLCLVALSGYSGLSHPRWFALAALGSALWSWADAASFEHHFGVADDAVLLIGVALTTSGAFAVAYRAAYPWWRTPPWLAAVMVAEPLVLALIAVVGGAPAWRAVIEVPSATAQSTVHRWGFFVHSFYVSALVFWTIVTALRYADHSRGRPRRLFLAIVISGIAAFAAQTAGLDIVQFLAFAEVVMVGIAVRAVDRDFAGLTDTTPQDRARRLGRLSDHRDAVTGTLARAALDLFLDSEVVKAARRVQPLSLLVIDIDKFKAVNDTHGHLGGDAVLAAVAERALAVVGSSGEVGRFGGDEFVVVLPGVDPEEAIQIAELILAAAHRPVQVEAATVIPSISIGMASYASGNARALVAAADAQMYRAKSSGGNLVAAPNRPVGSR